MKREFNVFGTRTFAAVSVVLALSVGGVAEAKPSSGTFRISATVPVSCWVRPDQHILVSEGTFGTVTEACNNPGGFTVTAVYRSLEGNERATMLYGEALFDLAGSTTNVVNTSDKATIRRVGYRFSNVVLNTPLVVALTIQPI